jgi:hypothetical protein
MTSSQKREARKMKRRWIFKAVKCVMLVALMATVLSLVAMSLWNWLAPALFGLNRISFWQTIGLLLLSKILFGRIGGPRGPHLRWRERMMER